jgi:CRISPR-associated protein Cmr2
MNLWKRKLAAFLHDPPSKCLEIRTHGERSELAFRQAGFTDGEIGEYIALADHTAAAADRLPFPSSRAAGLRSAFDGVRNAFNHPLGNGAEPSSRLPFHKEFPSAEAGAEAESSVQPILTASSLGRFEDEDLQWRARYFAHWRRWPDAAAEHDYRLRFLPADTRIPDHSIWNHMQVVSALAGCETPEGSVAPAFLKVQLGPVQEFIAAARSTRDLWSGSYLLSWLMAAGLKALSAEVGPDAVVFPSLRGQPLFDLHWREELWNKVEIGTGRPVWDSLQWSQTDLLTPNLPNVFLAVVPASRSRELGRKVEEAIQAEWKRIAAAVWKACDEEGFTACGSPFDPACTQARFDSQVARFLSISWQATDWPESLDEALILACRFSPDMPIVQTRHRIEAIVRMATVDLPHNHRDPRYYEGGEKGPRTQLNNIGLGWSVLLAFNNWALDATRNTRAFEAAATGGWLNGTGQNKDSLTGRDEAVAGGEDWGERARQVGGHWASLFKHDDWLSASTLIKRVWHRAYLSEAPWNLRTASSEHRMPNTRGIAMHDPFAKDDGSNSSESDDTNDSDESRYFAVLAFDGDEIGKWVSGQKTPFIRHQLSDYRDHGGAERHGALAYFEQSDAPAKAILEQQRPLSPAYHLQFSEALANFALHCARPIVEVFDGRLIYSGGDDVVALLPADSALACATALRMAFQGSPELGPYLETQARRWAKAGNPMPSVFQELAAAGTLLGVAQTPRPEGTQSHPGFLRRLEDSGAIPDKRRHADSQGIPIPFVVPGPAAEASVGVAIAHFKAPLQDVVRAAQAAEKRAKRTTSSGGLGRAAVAVTLMKRSGEIVEWGTRWEGGLTLHAVLSSALERGILSERFPHRLSELLEAYRIESTPMLRDRHSLQPAASFPVDDVIQREFAHVLSRQRGPQFPTDGTVAESEVQSLNSALTRYLTSLDQAGHMDPEARLRSLTGLCQTVAFTRRTESTLAPKGMRP